MSSDYEIKYIDNVIDEGKKIYSDYCKRVKNDEQFKSLSHQARYEYYMKMNIDFARQHPLILRHIASYGMFSAKAIKLYFQKCFRNNTNSDEEYCERQADFVKYNYMYSGKHVPQNKLNEIWAQTKKHMMDELEATAKEKKMIKEQREKNKNSNDIVRRENVKRLIQQRTGLGSSSCPQPSSDAGGSVDSINTATKNENDTTAGSNTCDVSIG